MAARTSVARRIPADSAHPSWYLRFRALAGSLIAAGTQREEARRQALSQTLYEFNRATYH
jgi:hypothetical protein